MGVWRKHLDNNEEVRMIRFSKQKKHWTIWHSKTIIPSPAAIWVAGEMKQSSLARSIPFSVASILDVAAAGDMHMMCIGDMHMMCIDSKDLSSHTATGIGRSVGQGEFFGEIVVPKGKGFC